MPTKATVANMRKFADKGPMLAWSPTGEEYSADAGDYWDSPEDYCLTDENGQDMFLVNRITVLVDVDR